LMLTDFGQFLGYLLTFFSFTAKIDPTHRVLLALLDIKFTSDIEHFWCPNTWHEIP
jgi:hypothetical protein